MGLKESNTTQQTLTQNRKKAYEMMRKHLLANRTNELILRDFLLLHEKQTAV